MPTSSRRRSYHSHAQNARGDLTWRVQEREDPTLTDWDRFARAEYVRLAMEEEGEFRASDGQNEIWVQQNLEVGAAPPRHCCCSSLCSLPACGSPKRLHHRRPVLCRDPSERILTSEAKA